MTVCKCKCKKRSVMNGFLNKFKEKIVYTVGRVIKLVNNAILELDMSDHTEQAPYRGSQRYFLGKYSQKTAVMVLLILLCAVATYYFHFVLRTEVLFTHVFYIPIVLAGLWWGKKGVWIAVLLAAIMLISHFISMEIISHEDIVRTVMFVAVGLTAGFITDHAWRIEKELRDTQEELNNKEKLAVLGELSGGVGHELRNPLGVISNSVYYLKSVLPDADEKVKEYLEIISSEVHSADKIISDLLDFSRIKPTMAERVDVSEMITKILEKQPAPEGIVVSAKVDPDVLQIFVDPLQIQLVLANLVTNAFQAMPKGGKLTIRAHAKNGRVHLSIADTGIGIPKENMDKIFEPLFTTKARGIGLGLVTSKRLVEANGGSIEVKSKEGHGSIFTVILPTKEVIS